MPVAAQSMVVRDEIDRSVIVVPENRLFSPGESALIANSDELLRPIAAGLKQTPGRVRIIGHTDSKLARSARFSSDWDLSVERARAVQAALQTLGIEATRISYDGHASIEPLQAADPARAIGGDGRVEILLLVGR
jgi:type VI secretion system protein ImpK